MDLIGVKLLAAVVLIAIGVGFGLLPYRISVSADGQRWLRYGNGFAGGVFIGAGLLHLLPDSVEVFSTFSGLPDYPIAFLVAGLGFLLIMFLEQVLLRGRDEQGELGGDTFPIVLFLVLSIHSFIAGTAMGLETMPAALVAVFVAIIAHKAFAAMALGISLVDAHVPFRRTVRTIVIFSVMTPLGLLVGTLFSQVLHSDAARLLEGTFDALAAGTFVYIATFEILPGIFDKRQGHIRTFLFVVAGFAVMALLAIWA